MKDAATNTWNGMKVVVAHGPKTVWLLTSVNQYALNPHTQGSDVPDTKLTDDANGE